MIKTSLIAKNTFFLYVRMLLVLTVTLFTSRIVLQVLGVDDYGIYQTVGGIIGFLAMANSALSAGTSRFIAYELGRNDHERLHKVFCVALLGHVIVALIICFLAETIGLWFVCNKLEIPANRMDAAIFTYHVTILTSFFLLTQTPYTALIIAHEKMNIYAYVSIVEVLLKLGIVYLLMLGGVDKLKLYVFLVFIVQLLLVLFYRLYCRNKFKESALGFEWNRDIWKSVFNFSGLNFVIEGTKALNNQGFLILTNMFFGPAVVAARSIALQVNSAANQFVNNFRLASNPQIIKLEASGNVSESHLLVLQSAKYTYFLMLLLALPIALGAKPLLLLWLGQVPAYSVIFLQLVIIQSLVSTFDLSFHYAIQAKGKLREETLTTSLIVLISFGIVFVLFKKGFSPLSLCFVAIAQFAILGFFIKPFILHKIFGYKRQDFIRLFANCFFVTFISVVIPILTKYFLSEGLLSLLVCTTTSIVSVLVCVFIWGIDKKTRNKLKKKFVEKLKTAR